MFSADVLNMDKPEKFAIVNVSRFTKRQICRHVHTEKYLK